MSSINYDKFYEKSINAFLDVSRRLDLSHEDCFDDMISVYIKSKVGLARNELSTKIYQFLLAGDFKNFVSNDVLVNRSSLDRVNTVYLIAKNTKLPVNATAYIGIYLRDLVVRFEYNSVSSRKTKIFIDYFEKSRSWFEKNSFTMEQKSRNFIIESRKNIKEWHTVDHILIANIFKDMCKYLNLV